MATRRLTGCTLALSAMLFVCIAGLDTDATLDVTEGSLLNVGHELDDSRGRGRGRGRPNMFRSSRYVVSNRGGSDEADELGEDRGRGRGRSSRLYAFPRAPRAGVANRGGSDEEELGDPDSSLGTQIQEARKELLDARAQLHAQRANLTQAQQAVRAKASRMGVTLPGNKDAQDARLKLEQDELKVLNQDKEILSKQKEQMHVEQQQLAKNQQACASGTLLKALKQVLNSNQTKVLQPTATCGVQTSNDPNATEIKMPDNVWERVGELAGQVENQEELPGQCSASYAVYLKTNGTGSERAVWFGWSKFDPFSIDGMRLVPKSSRTGFGKVARRRTFDKMAPGRRRCGEGSHNLDSKEYCQHMKNPCSCRDPGSPFTAWGKLNCQGSSSRCSCRACPNSNGPLVDAGVNYNSWDDDRRMPSALYGYDNGDDLKAAAPPVPTHGEFRVAGAGQCFQNCACNVDDPQNCRSEPHAVSIEAVFCPNIKCKKRHDKLNYFKRGFTTKKYWSGDIKTANLLPENESINPIRGGDVCEVDWDNHSQGVDRKANQPELCNIYKKSLAFALGCRKPKKVRLKRHLAACEKDRVEKEGREAACVDCTTGGRDPKPCITPGSNGCDINTCKTEGYCTWPSGPHRPKWAGLTGSDNPRNCVPKTSLGHKDFTNNCDKYDKCRSIAGVPDIPGGSRMRRRHNGELLAGCRVVRATFDSTGTIEMKGGTTVEVDKLTLVPTQANKRDCDMDNRDWSGCVRRYASETCKTSSWMRRRSGKDMPGCSGSLEPDAARAARRRAPTKAPTKAPTSPPTTPPPTSPPTTPPPTTPSPTAQRRRAPSFSYYSRRRTSSFSSSSYSRRRTSSFSSYSRRRSY